jgi:hypothetical protein
MTESPKVAGSVSRGITSKWQIKVAVLVTKGLDSPQQWLSAMYFPLRSLDKIRRGSTELTSDPTSITLAGRTGSSTLTSVSLASLTVVLVPIDILEWGGETLASLLAVPEQFGWCLIQSRIHFRTCSKSGYGETSFPAMRTLAEFSCPIDLSI